MIFDRPELRPDLREVDTPDGLAQAKRDAQSALNRSKRRRRIKSVAKTAAYYALLIKSGGIMSALKEKLSLRLQSTKEGMAWVFTLLVIVGGYFGFGWTAEGLAEIYDKITVAAVGLVGLYYAIKDLFVRKD